MKGPAARLRQRVQLSIGAISVGCTGDPVDVLTTADAAAATAAAAANLANLPPSLDLPEDLTVQADHQAHRHDKVGQ